MLAAGDEPRDVRVLAERAAQGAAAEEDRPRAVRAAQAVLLAEVREGGRDHGTAADLARARLAVEAPRPARARAQATGLEGEAGVLGARPQATVTLQREVGRLEARDTKPIEHRGTTREPQDTP